MKTSFKLFNRLLFLFDISWFYLSLIGLLLIRYQNLALLNEHLFSFSLVLLGGIVIFYINELYEIEKLSSAFYVFLRTIISVGILFLLSVTIFYFFPFEISPKRNLIIFLIIYCGAVSLARLLVWSYLSKKQPVVNLIYVGYKNSGERLKIHLLANPQLKFQILAEFEPDNIDWNFLEQQSKQENCLILISNKINLQDFSQHLFHFLGPSLPIKNLITFFENFFGFIPLEEINEAWILEELIDKEDRFRQFSKRIFDICLAILIGILTLPLWLLISLAVYFELGPPIFFVQKRIGKQGKEFSLIKFRTMKGTKDPGKWARKDDPRISWVGKILRRSHLDELPQIINVLKGELSFVGPRPEQVPLVEILRKKIPFYDLRHIVLPGITGWAQLNFIYSASVEESKIKLEYDLYYLKNQSFWLDLLILIKSIKKLFG